MNFSDLHNIKWANAIDSLSIGIILHQHDGKIIYCNASAENILGARAEHIIGQSSIDLHYSAIREDGSTFEKEEQPAARAIRECAHQQDIVLGLRGSDGNTKWLDINAEILPAGIAKSNVYVLISFIDITARKTQQQKVRDEERKYQAAINSLGDSAWEHDFSTGRTWFSDSIYEILGYRASEIGDCAELWWGEINPDDKWMLEQNYQDYSAGIISKHSLEYRMTHKDGTERWVLDRGKVHTFDEAGKPLKIIGTHQDITERKKWQEKLSQNEAMFRSLVTNVKDYAIFMLDARGTVITWNKGAEAIKGYTEEEIKGKNISVFYTEPDRESNLHQHVLDMAAKHGRFENEGWRVKKNGALFWADVVVTALTDSKGKLYGFAKVTRDITEKKLAEEARQDLTEKLLNSNRELERFAFVASHDLQEPLRMISSFLRLLEKRLDGTLDETNKKYIDFAVDGAVRMKALIDDLLEYSTINAKKEMFAETDVNEIISYTTKLLGETITRKHAVITLVHMPSIVANKNLISQVFVNLVSNSLKFSTESAPHIDIGYTEEPTRWVFFVKDNGIGIDPKFFDKIFIIFQRLHNKTKYSGTGIGLSICKKIVEGHGGTIWVESEKGKGSCFYFSIPKKII